MNDKLFEQFEQNAKKQFEFLINKERFKDWSKEKLINELIDLIKGGYN